MSSPVRAALRVPVSGQVTGEPEVRNLLEVGQSGHYGGGPWTRRFEREFAGYMGARFCSLVNSGSSANLLALAALELPKGAEVITTAVNFPTTVNAIVQLGLVPVFVDSDPRTLAAIWPAIGGQGQHNIQAGIVAHTLGNPSEVPVYGLTPFPFIEDCCDAIGSKVNGVMVGRRGVMATASFYPAHHMTMGEGGAVLTDHPRLRKVLESYRDWGRDCWCEPGEDNTCGTRFEGDYDHKYTYSRIGYNLKATDLQAAVGVAQLDRLPGFVQKRKENWAYLRDRLDGLPLDFVEATPGSDPSWFGFAFLVQDRNRLARYLDDHGVGNRPIMGGNLTRQPAYRNVEYRVLGSLAGADRIHEQGLWIGCFPGIILEMLDYVVDTMKGFFA